MNDRVDALVIFGATGDLAKLETFPALVGLVDRGVLDVPIVGVAKSGWNLDRFREFAAASLRAAGMNPDSPAAARMLGLLRYDDGDLDEDATFAAMSREMGSGGRALYYLEVPAPLFGRIARGIATAGRAEGARVMVEKPFGTNLGNSGELNETMHAVFPADAVYRVDHWLGLDPLNNVSVARFANSITGPLLNGSQVAGLLICASPPGPRTTAARAGRLASPTRASASAAARLGPAVLFFLFPAGRSGDCGPLLSSKGARP